MRFPTRVHETDQVRNSDQSRELRVVDFRFLNDRGLQGPGWKGEYKMLKRIDTTAYTINPCTTNGMK